MEQFNKINIFIMCENYVRMPADNTNRREVETVHNAYSFKTYHHTWAGGLEERCTFDFALSAAALKTLSKNSCICAEFYQYGI